MSAPKLGTKTHIARWKILIIAVLILIGVTLVLSPFLVSYLNSLTQSSVIDGYISDAASESTQEMDAQIQEAMEYNSRLLNSSAIMTDPFSLEAYQAVMDGYDSILNITETGMMGYLDIPSIAVHLPIYHGTGTYALQHGVGHLQTTSIPVGGESTHAVLSAHSGLTNADMFDNLQDMEIGDTFSVTILNHTVYYQVYATEVILPEQTESLNIQLGRDLVTLVTCTPYGVNSHRLLVHGERIDDPTQAADDVSQLESDKTVGHHLTMQQRLLLIALAGLVAPVVITIVICKMIDHRKKHQRSEL